MSKVDKRTDKKLQSILSDLTSGNELKFSSAISALQSEGRAVLVPELAQLLRFELSDKNRTELIELLNNLNDSEVKTYMMDIIRDDNNADIRQVLLATIWNSKIDYSEFLADFVAVAVDGDFMEALECLTVIENLEGPFAEQLILESQLHLRDYAQDLAPKDPQKMQIMSEIALFIKEQDLLEGDGIEEYL